MGLTTKGLNEAGRVAEPTPAVTEGAAPADCVATGIAGLARGRGAKGIMGAAGLGWVPIDAVVGGTGAAEGAGWMAGIL